MQEIKLNIGSGTTFAQNFQNFDNSPSVVVSKIPIVKTLLHRMGLISRQQLEADWSGVNWLDVTKGLPFKKNSVSKIYSSHFLEHISEEKARGVLQECYRVLKKDGVMRLVVPDLLFHAERYVERTKALLAKKSLDRSAHDEFMETVAGSFINGGRKGLRHCYMYDLPSLVSLLKTVGFQNIQQKKYQQGSDPELYHLDSRPNESLHLEVEK